jgi:hypothetical protein
MAIALATFSSTVDGILSADNDELSAVRRQDMIKAALERYSHDAPDEITKDITGSGSKYYIVSSVLFPDFVEGFSRVVSIQYPAATVASNEAPTYLDPEDWDDNYWVSGVRYLWMPNHTPTAPEKVRVTHTVPYAFSAGEVDIPTAHFYTVCLLSAGLCAQAIADKYSRTSDSTLAVDSVDHLSRAQEWSRRARELINMYKELMGLSGGDDTVVQGAGDFVDWDTAPSWPRGRRYMFHGPETR